MSRRRHHRETNGGGVDSMLAAGAHVALSGYRRGTPGGGRRARGGGPWAPHRRARL